MLSEEACVSGLPRGIRTRFRRSLRFLGFSSSKPETLIPASPGKPELLSPKDARRAAALMAAGSSIGDKASGFWGLGGALKAEGSGFEGCNAGWPASAAFHIHLKSFRIQGLFDVSIFLNLCACVLRDF